MYFDRRGEVNELRVLIRTSQSERDVEKAKEAMKRIISYMSLGIDLSRLFPDVLMLCHTSDLVLKKLIYHYLTAHAEQNAEMAILLVNALQKDVRDVDPAVRTLALRSLANLRLANILEYLEPAIFEALRDGHGLVRRAAVVAVAKLPRRRGREFSGVLAGLLTAEGDGDVVSSVLNVLEHLKTLAVDEALVSRLIEHLPLYSEWAQVAVLRILHKNIHLCKNDTFYALLNVLDYIITHTNNASVMLYTCELFVAVTCDTELHNEALTRVKQPLLNMAATALDAEVGFVLYTYILSLVRLYSDLFVSEVGEFAVGFDHPVYLKTLKLDILYELAIRNRSIADFAISELKSGLYDCDVDVQVASVRHLVQLAGNLGFPAIDAVVLLIASAPDTLVLSECLAGLQELHRLGNCPLSDISDSLHGGIMYNLHPSTSAAAGLTARGQSALLWLAAEFPQAFLDVFAVVAQPLGVWETRDAEVKLAALRAAGHLLFWDARSGVGVFKALLSRSLADGEDPDVAQQARRYAAVLTRGGVEELRPLFA